MTFAAGTPQTTSRPSQAFGPSSPCIAGSGFTATEQQESGRWVPSPRALKRHSRSLAVAGGREIVGIVATRPLPTAGLKQPARRHNRVGPRSLPSIFFVIGRDGTRDQVIRMYEVHVRRSPDLIAALPELPGKRLGCYCKPLPCHGDVLVKLLAEFFSDL